MKKFHSSALGYAISFLLIIALICSGVLFISSANKRLEFHYALKEHLLFDNYVALKLGASYEEPTTKTIVHLAGDTPLRWICNPAAQF